jgi:beta-mannosidase
VIESRTLHEGWTVRAAKGRAPVSVREAGVIPATVPGTVHTDLLAAGLIDDPYLDDNEHLQAWIGSTDFVYELAFDWNAEGADRVDLAFDGLDTIATVRLNGTTILEAANQHRSYRLPVERVLREGRNELEVAFSAPVPAANRAAGELGRRPHVNHHPYNAIRKMASSFGWDWGIDTATSGIWRPVRLDSWSTARIVALRVVPTIDGTDGLAEVSVDLDRATDAALDLRVTLAGATVVVPVPAGASSATAVARVADVERWWPRGHGEPHRYDLTVDLVDAAAITLDDRALAIGFRTVEVDVTPDADGTPFRLVVNGRPTYVRGVNWIPDDAFPHRVDRARYAKRIAQAASAGVNLIRVWGGGRYESDDFYDLCDETGMLTWQDFLFACAAYAEEEPLRSEVEAEAREAVTRLARHPSLVLFNGNNENLEGFEEWGWPTWLEGRTWGGGYYYDLLPSIVAELAPHVPYTPGSPFSPGGEHRPNDPAHGSVHIWDLWNQRDWPDYREYRPRFVAEFGWQGPPTWATLTRSISDDPLTPESPGMQVHQKAADGNAKLAGGLIAHAPLPVDMPDWNWAMQLNQARAVGTALEHFRSLAPLCGGSIVWQLNDCWPVTSWAAIDGDGREKPLLAAIRHAYADRLVTIQPRDDGLAVVLSNETPQPWQPKVVVERVDAAGNVLATDTLEADVLPWAATTLALAGSIAVASDPARELVRARAVAALPAWWFFSDYREALLEPAEVSVRTLPTLRGLEVEITAHTLVRDLAILPDLIDVDAAVDDQLVHLLPGQSVTFEVIADRRLDPAALAVPGVIRTGNDLVAGPARVTLETKEAVA